MQTCLLALQKDPSFDTYLFFLLDFQTGGGSILSYRYCSICCSSVNLQWWSGWSDSHGDKSFFLNPDSRGENGSSHVLSSWQWTDSIHCFESRCGAQNQSANAAPRNNHCEPGAKALSIWKDAMNAGMIHAFTLRKVFIFLDSYCPAHTGNFSNLRCSEGVYHFFPPFCALVNVTPLRFVFSSARRLVKIPAEC